MARLFLPHSPHSPRILDLSSRACTECVVDCDDSACKAGIDDRCTDQCVIVPCDNPEHDDAQCSEGTCEPTCGVPDNCLLPGHALAPCDTLQHKSISCGQDSCYKSTCNDPDNCSLVNATEHVPLHSPPFIPEHTYSPHTHSGDWDAALEAFLCSCGVPLPSQDSTVSQSFLRDPYVGSSPVFSTLASPSETNSLSSAFDMSLPPPECTPPLCMVQPPAAVVSHGHTCFFSSLMELISHVNVSHLRTYSSQLSEPVATPPSYLRLSPDSLGLPCQWGNCHEYSSTPPDSSSSLALDAALNSLTGHLLHDHLGLQSGPGDHSVVATNHAAVADVGLPAPALNSGQDVEMQDQEPSLDNKQQSIPLAGSEKQDDINRWNTGHDHLPTAEDKTPISISGAEKCRWRGCELSFASVDDLMNHLTAEHVGSGKNHYECFWSGCERSGENGFASKQKVCRHLQMHTGHKPFQCELCQQHFSEAATLQQHMRRHTQEKPYPCDVPGCGKAFAIAGALTIHRRTHIGLKPFKCKYCERAFSESSNLSKHMRTHTGVRPYVCEEPGCGKTFARPDQFTRHQRVHSKRNHAAKPGNNGEMSQVF
ncbi:hypothetical protein BC826DRAFT_1030989, partial [Russula brevipes]